jgi:hypothetical protein
MKFSRWILLVAAFVIINSFSTGELKAAGKAQARRTASASVRHQRVSGMGHHVGIANGHYEGVAMAPTRKGARDSTCYSNDPNRTRIASKVKRAPGGMFVASNVYR